MGMPATLVTTAYLAAGVLFILSLGGLSNQETARRGNLLGIIGMVIAVLATLASDAVTSYALLGGALAVGAVIGALLAARVEMTNMPQLVAILHSFVGLAAVLVGFATFLDTAPHGGVEAVIHDIEVYVGIFIGAITFTGSVVAFGKLQGVVTSKPLLLPAGVPARTVTW
jgi:NAD(P) transhydrogenase subunit beta